MTGATTTTGLQSLVNFANEYILKHGLRLYRTTTNYVITGKMPFKYVPEWYTGEDKLNIVDNILAQ